MPPLRRLAACAAASLLACGGGGTTVLTLPPGGLPPDALPPRVNRPPLASAGPDRTVRRREPVTLAAVASDPDGDPLTVVWTQTAGPSVTLTGATGRSPTFTAPATECDLTFRVTARDAAASAADEVTVRVRNAPPTVAVRLSPSGPRTLDDLTATATTSDPDGEPVTVSWAWRRNGVVVPGALGAVLPASETTRGDVIAAIATATDGVLATSAEATVTILDTPPILTSDAPAEVAYGPTATWHVAAYDPDGDPLPPVALEYGPAGMTVGADGTVRWPVTLPLLDRSLDVRWSVVMRGAAPARLRGTTRVVDAARAYALRRSGVEIPRRPAGLAVQDLDGDGRAEALVAGLSGVSVLGRLGAGYAHTWSYPFALAPGFAVEAVAARDLDGDGRAEIFAAAGSVLVLLDGVTRREALRHDGGAGFSCVALAVADLDHDGAQELVCLGGTDYSGDPAVLTVFDAATLVERWRTPTLVLGLGLAVGNVDGDAALEIVTSGGYVFDGATGANEWAYGPGFGNAVAAGDVDGDGIAEIVGAPSFGAVRVYGAVARSPLYELTGATDVYALWSGDLDRDGKVEIVTGDRGPGFVSGWRRDARSGAFAKVWSIAAQNYGVSAVAAGDVDGDGANEVVWGAGIGDSGEDSVVIAGFNPGVGVEWTNAAPAELDGPFLGARPVRLAAGRRVLFATGTDAGYGGTRLVVLDAASGLWTASADILPTYDTLQALDAADVDGDGVDEALTYTADNTSTYLASLDAVRGVAEWRSPGGFGGAAAVAHADLDRDGRDDVVALSFDGYLSAYSPSRQVLLWKSVALGGNGVALATADLDGDGQAELAALTSARLVTFHAAAGAVPWLETGSWAVADGAALAVADGDADGAPELFVLAQPWSSPAHVTRLDAALRPLSSFTLELAATSLFAEDLGFARQGLVLGMGDRWGYDDAAAPPHLRAVDPITGEEIWRSPPLLGPVQPASLSYPDLGDGRRRLAFGTLHGMYVTR